ncbi:MAG: hypothetical protein JWL72_4032 [Ilumatobacteraceae bacterium]|nr:hypothetical protein [Ilumatobacteraceae bacterium]
MRSTLDLRDKAVAPAHRAVALIVSAVPRTVHRVRVVSGLEWPLTWYLSSGHDGARTRDLHRVMVAL